MSDSSIDMKQKSPCTAEFKANGGCSGSPLPNDYFVAGGRLAAKVSSRQREIRGQEFCRQGWRPPVSLTVAVRSTGCWKIFCGTHQPTMLDRAKHIQRPGVFQSFPETSFRWGNAMAFRDQRHRRNLVNVRIYYLKMQFIEGFTMILAMQFCAPVTQGNRKFMSDSSIDMNKESQETAATRRMVLWKN
jgi:hypothetical protein